MLAVFHSLYEPLSRILWKAHLQKSPLWIQSTQNLIDDDNMDGILRMTGLVVPTEA